MPARFARDCTHAAVGLEGAGTIERVSTVLLFDGALFLLQLCRCCGCSSSAWCHVVCQFCQVTRTTKAERGQTECFGMRPTSNDDRRPHTRVQYPVPKGDGGVHQASHDGYIVPSMCDFRQEVHFSPEAHTNTSTVAKTVNYG